MHLIVGVTMIVLLLMAFWAMTRHNVQQALAMPLLACAFIALAPTQAADVLEGGFREFAKVIMLFTAVAVPAHMIERSGAFQYLAAWLGLKMGMRSLRRPGSMVPLLVVIMLVSTYVAAGLLHNVTSILIMSHITIGLCTTYRVPSRWLLSGELIASNLGGFSTAWGDTPNIIEGAVWGLTHADFFKEILPPNMCILAVLAGVVATLTRRDYQADSDPHRDVWPAVDYGIELRRLSVDCRLLSIGASVLVMFIGAQYLRKDLELVAAAVAIAVAVLLERRAHQLKTLHSLDLDLYSTLAAIFVLARCVEHSWLGDRLHSLVLNTSAAPWAIAVSAYFGTAFTEAASWASAVAGPIHAASTSHAAAWALGGGICAGSSSLLTAASAGIILAAESRRYPGHEVTFGLYLAFGLPASLLMLAFYATYFTFWR